ncbi:MAG: protein kinase [Polyangiales bacterium]
MGGQPKRRSILELGGQRIAVQKRLPWGGLVSYFDAAESDAPRIVALLPFEARERAHRTIACRALAKDLSTINSPHLPRLIEYGLNDGVPYFSFEHFAGEPLSERMRRGPMPVTDAIAIVSGVLRAVIDLNNAGLVHADITPNNIIVSEGEGLNVVLVGGGFANLMRDPELGIDSRGRMGSGQFCISYMAPELFGHGPVRPTVDVYSAAALLYHLVVGKPRSGAIDLSPFADALDLPIIIEQAMSKHGLDRYDSPHSLLAALEWAEIFSENPDFHTREIAPWMFDKKIGDIPVVELTNPPRGLDRAAPFFDLKIDRSPIDEAAYLARRDEPVRARPVLAPVIVDETMLRRERLWWQVAVLLVATLGLLLTLAFQIEKPAASSVTLPSVARIPVAGA